MKRRFGISTHLYHSQRLSRDHLAEIAAHGFEAVEVWATRSHFDYHNPAAAADLQEWLAASGLELHGVHAPVGERYAGGRFDGVMSVASADSDARARAVADTEKALHVARRIPMQVCVVHLGMPRGYQTGAPDSRAAARRSIEELAPVAAQLGVRLAVEVIPNELSRAASLVHFVEDDLEGLDVAICLDFGHAHLDGNLVDAIETVSEHLVTTHVHDNGGRRDDHLVPFDGTIDWPSSLIALQKVGYDGTIVFEIAPPGPPKDALVKARRARERMDKLLSG